MRICEYDGTKVKTLFCQECGRADPDELKTIRFGFKGGKPSGKVAEFWESGDPSVFASPGALDYRGGG